MMSMARPAAVAALALALTGCTSMQHGKQVVRAPARCADQSVEVYFEQFSAEISKDGQAVIRAAADAAKPCKVSHKARRPPSRGGQGGLVATQRIRTVPVV